MLIHFIQSWFKPICCFIITLVPMNDSWIQIFYLYYFKVIIYFIELMKNHIQEGLDMFDYIIENNFYSTVKHNAFNIPAEERDESIKDSLKALVNKESGILLILILQTSKRFKDKDELFELKTQNSIMKIWRKII